MWNFLKNIFGFGKPVHEYDAYGVTSKSNTIDQPVVPFVPPTTADLAKAYGKGYDSTKSSAKELPKAVKPQINPKTGKAMPVRGKGGKFQKTNA